MNQEYLRHHQRVLYQTFLHALQDEQVSHAYLLLGEPGTPLLETAIYLAKTLVCDDPRPFACNECLTCLRIDEGNFADLMIFDGQSHTIKKDEIQALEANFERTAIEEKGKMIYILHLVENMTAEAVNSLLKFLEEPGENVYAFLTTENESRVLATIVSRAQRLPLRRVSQNEVIEEALALGVDHKDAELLSFFYNDPSLVAQKVEDEAYQVARNLAEILLQSLRKSDKEAILILQTEIASNLKSKESARFFLDVLIVFFREILAISGNRTIQLRSYVTILTDLASLLPGLENTLYTLMTARGELDFNVNIPLLLDHLAYTITKGDEYYG